MKVQDKIIRQTVKFSKKMCLLNVTWGGGSLLIK